MNATKICHFKTKDSQLKNYCLCLENISEDFPVNNLQKAGLNGCLYIFPVDYKAFDTSDIINNDKNLMGKFDIK